jgi:hypothetical protein
LKSDSKKKGLFSQLEKLATEGRNPNTKEIDLASAHEIARLINLEDQKVALQVGFRCLSGGRSIIVFWSRNQWPVGRIGCG